jgi:hypothetical protein
MALGPEVVVAATAPHARLHHCSVLRAAFEPSSLKLLWLTSATDDLKAPWARTDDLVAQTAGRHALVRILHQSDRGELRHMSVDDVPNMLQRHAY